MKTGVGETQSRVNWAGYMALAKPRLSVLSTLSCTVAYLLAIVNWQWLEFIWLVLGTQLCAAGALALNQCWEHQSDAKMERTRGRPIPAGILTAGQAWVFGLGCALAGLLLLYFGTNAMAAGLGALTIITYVLIYTPLKRITRWATEFGTLPGALPPLMGWSAATGDLPGMAWLLFLIVVFWQLPHFMAIAWLYRHEYAQANFPMLPGIDSAGHRTARWAMVNACILASINLLAVIFGYCGWFYLMVVMALSTDQLIRCFQFMQQEDKDVAARALFFSTLYYLPIIYAALLIEHWFI